MFADKGRKAAAERAGREVLRAACATDEETQQAVASPFLYARIRARIAAEQQARERTGDAASAVKLWAVARRAIPALALVAILALSSFWMFGTGATSEAMTTQAPPPAAVLLPEQPSLVVTACSLAAKDECAVSTNDVMALLMNTGEGQKR